MKMHDRAPTTLLAAAGAIALLSALPGIAAAESTINKRTASSPTGMVEISNTVGSVVVTGWDLSLIHI